MRLALLFLFLPLLAFSQPVQRQFFTTNTDPRVTVVAGTNAFITASTPLPNVRQFLIDVPSIGGSGQTNLALVVAGTNATVVASTNLGVTTFTVSSTASGSGQTNLTLIVAGTNVFVTSATNLGVTTFTIDGPALRATWSVGDITNAGTLAYSNVAVLIGATNTATLQTQLGLGTAAYSNTAAFLLKSGDTSTGPQLTSSASASGPAPNEFVTGGWVRGLFANAGQLFYTTTNIYPIGTNVGSAQPEYEYSTNIPLPAVRSYSTAAGDFLTNNGYIGSVIVTNVFQQLGGQITVSAYLGYTGGGGSPTLTLHPEIYYSYDRTNWLGDYSAADQSVPTGQTNLRQWVIDFPAQFSTNATGFWIQRRFKVGAVTGTGTRTLWVLVGTNAISGTSDAAHISVPLPSGGLTTVPARTIGITVDGGGVALTAGTKGFIEVPYAGTVKAGTLLADQNGSIQVETWRTNAGNLTLLARAGALGSNWLTSTNWSKDYALTGWSSTSIASNDILGFVVTSNAASCTRVTFQLQVQP